MSDTDPDHTPRVHVAEVDAAYWVLWDWWRRNPTLPPNSAAIHEALAAAKRAMVEHSRSKLAPTAGEGEV